MDRCAALKVMAASLCEGRRKPASSVQSQSRRGTMSRKDYILIAATIRQLPFGGDNYATVALAFAAALQSTNPCFSRERFLAACSVHTEQYHTDVQATFHMS
jgi:hypothetical protein